MVTRRSAPLASPPEALLTDLRYLIEQARAQVAQAANSALTLLYWHLGQRIRREVLDEKRARYGEEILPTLSAKLVPQYGQGFSARNLGRMVQFALARLPDAATLRQRLHRAVEQARERAVPQRLAAPGAGSAGEG